MSARRPGATGRLTIIDVYSTVVAGQRLGSRAENVPRVRARLCGSAEPHS